VDCCQCRTSCRVLSPNQLSLSGPERRAVREQDNVGTALFPYYLRRTHSVSRIHLSPETWDPRVRCNRFLFEQNKCLHLNIFETGMCRSSRIRFVDRFFIFRRKGWNTVRAVSLQWFSIAGQNGGERASYWFTCGRWRYRERPPPRHCRPLITLPDWLDKNEENEIQHLAGEIRRMLRHLRRLIRMIMIIDDGFLLFPEWPRSRWIVPTVMPLLLLLTIIMIVHFTKKKWKETKKVDSVTSLWWLGCGVLRSIRINTMITYWLWWLWLDSFSLWGWQANRRGWFDFGDVVWMWPSRRSDCLLGLFLSCVIFH